MIQAYLPSPGERVRVVSICDANPARLVGDEFEVAEADEQDVPRDIQGRYVYVRAVGDASGTWCRVQPLPPAPAPAPVVREAARWDVVPITRDSFLATLAASEEGEDMTGAEMCAEWDMLHENAELCYARGDMRDIDEDP